MAKIMTEKEMNKVMDDGTIDQCTEDEKKQVFAFAFGDEFMNSSNKGKKVQYQKNC